MWALMRAQLRRVPHSDWRRIENNIEAGTPDVNGCAWGADFWMELKRKAHRNKRELGEVLSLPLFTIEQRLWLSQRHASGGIAMLVLHIEQPDEWMVFCGEVAREKVGYVTHRELGHLALATLEGKFHHLLIRNALAAYPARPSFLDNGRPGP